MCEAQGRPAHHRGPDPGGDRGPGTPARCLSRGQRGELVYTTLTKRARPMIRFRTGDIGYFDHRAPASAGAPWARIHILGRKDEMFIVSAVNVFPSDIEYIVRKDEGPVRRVPHPRVRRELHHPLRGVRGARPWLRRALRRGGRTASRTALKTHTGVRPAKVLVYDAGKLGTSSEHKA